MGPLTTKSSNIRLLCGHDVSILNRLAFVIIQTKLIKHNTQKAQTLDEIKSIINYILGIP